MSKLNGSFIVQSLGGVVEPRPDDEAKSDIERRRKRSISMHTERLSKDRMEKALAALSRRTSALPNYLKKQHVDNFLRGGKLSDAYKQLATEQAAHNRLQMRHISEVAKRRELELEAARDEALSSELKILEERWRRSRPSEEVVRESARRERLTKDWCKSVVVPSSEYWRKPPRGKELVMKEFVRETTFEDILDQRGFFGRKVKRENNSYYVPVSAIQFPHWKTMFWEGYRAEEITDGHYFVRKDQKSGQMAKEEPSENAESAPPPLQDVKKATHIDFRPFDFLTAPRSVAEEVPLGKAGVLAQKPEIPIPWAGKSGQMAKEEPSESAESAPPSLQDVNKVRPIDFRPFDFLTAPRGGENKTNRRSLRTFTKVHI